MLITHIRITNFRGWEDLDLKPRGHALVFGEPRAGRSDLIAALTRVLDPRSTRMQPTTGDVHQDMSSGTLVMAGYAEVEVTFAQLPADVELEADGALEPLLPDGTVDGSGAANPAAPLGLRLAYRVSYDATTDSLDHRVFYPVASDPTLDKYVRVPTAVRELLPVVFFGASRPLQLRAEGVLRRLVTDHDSVNATAALQTLEADIAAAASTMSASAAIQAVLDAVLTQNGPARRIGDSPLTAADVQFLPEDGSLAGLLRAVQPMLRLDQAGPLPLASHGSTAAAALSAAEALLLCSAIPGAIVIGDDVGEGLDGPTTEHLTGSLRRASSQVVLTTRRADAVRAFETVEVVRLTRHTGSRLVHQVSPPVDRKEASVHRHIQGQLLPALTATTLAVCEGRHDLSAFSAADRRQVATVLPLAAHGVRLISADSGSGGGTSQIPLVANLAKQLGYRVVAIVDGDPAKYATEALAQIKAACDAVVRLPTSVAVERAILIGASVDHIRAAASVFPTFGQPDPCLGRSDNDVVAGVTRLLHKKGLHEQFFTALVDETGALPPLMESALASVALCSSPTYTGPSQIDLVDLSTIP
ncbi:OLD family protein [Nostocoides australiense]